MSPVYHALRDGNTLTIPAAQAPGNGRPRFTWTYSQPPEGNPARAAEYLGR